MHWNYRICKETINNEVYYSIRELYYKDDGSIVAYTEECCNPFGETKEELIKDIELMLSTRDQPIIDIDVLKRTKGW